MKKRVFILLVAMALLIFTGCSTSSNTPRSSTTTAEPDSVISVGDRVYSTSEYKAYLYNSAAMIYAYYAYYADPSTMWEQVLPYSNPYARETSGDDEGEQVNTAEYIRRTTKDTILYLAAIEALMTEYGIELDDTDKAEAEANGYVDDLMNVVGFDATESTARSLGFSLADFQKMYLATHYSEKALLHGLYGKGGKQEVPEKELRAYFDENYLVYEIIQIALVDSEGNPLSSDDAAQVKARINQYLAVYEQTGDFDKAIEAYDNYGTEDPLSDAETYEDGSANNVTNNKSVNVIEIDAKAYSDQHLVAAIRSVKEGEVKIVEYKQGGNDDMIALIYRIDADGTGRETYYDDSRDELLQKVCEDDFKNLIFDKMDEQVSSLQINQSAIDTCKPEDFFK